MERPSRPAAGSQVAQVLDRRGWSRPISARKWCDLLGSGVLAEHHLGRIAGDKPQQGEGEEGQAQQRAKRKTRRRAMCRVSFHRFIGTLAN